MSADFQSGGDPSLLSSKMVEMKAPGAFRTISEVASNLEVPQHVLRFWESKFQQVRPLKRGGGRRYYRPEDVVLLTSIKDLLYNQGFTIRGVQKLLRESGRSTIMRPSTMETARVSSSSSPSLVTHASTPSSSTMAPKLSATARRDVESVLSELKALRELLRQSGI